MPVESPAKLLLACPRCLTANRVPDARLSDDPKCGKCGAQLLEGKPVALTDATFRGLPRTADGTMTLQGTVNKTGFALLVVIVVLQNLEPTSIDVLFWSMKSVPKLFLLLVSMLIGAATWEILRRLLRRPSATP